VRISLPNKLLLGLILAAAGSSLRAETTGALVAELLRDPSVAEWRALGRFDGTLTRADFEGRLDGVFDPDRGIRPYLLLTDRAVWVFATTERNGPPLAEVHFARAGARRPLPVEFRTPRAYWSTTQRPPSQPLLGLRIAIDPADIGGRWARMEDRSVNFKGYGLINEGDLNLVVGRLLRDRLTALGAQVFLVRNSAEPVVPLRTEDVLPYTRAIMERYPAFLQLSYQHRVQGVTAENERLHIAAEVLLTKALETRARVALVRRSFQPDLTIILQHNATSESTDGHLTTANRNIFFVNGAYGASELAEPEQRFRLLTKLLENVTPTEIRVATAVAGRFQAATGYPPVLYGNSPTTRLVAPGDPYVVARNLAFNREHDGPVVVTEPYFMNQPETLMRLLAGDYTGRRLLAGKSRISIYREYAYSVAAGIVDAYRTP
jgi:N-acetylmuramoyl-L-alanine amidase